MDADRQALSALAGWFRQQLIAALTSGSREDAERVVREAIDASLRKQTIYDEVIAVAMQEIGRRWEAGELTVAEEHLATSISYGLIALLSELSRVEEARGGGQVLLAAVEGERHVLGLEMAADILEGAGFKVIFLGADVPTDSLLDFLASRQISVCGLTATMPDRREQLTSTVRLIEDLMPRVSVLVGGQAASRLAPLGPTAAAVPDVASVVETADALLQAAALN